MAKMILPDNSPQNKKRMVAASGGYQTNDTPMDKNSHTQYAHSTTANLPITKNAQYAGAGANVAMSQPMFFSPLHTPQNWQIASRRREIMQWARFYYMNEPKVAAGVDFYANFSMNGFKLECKSRKILKYYERLVENIDLSEKLNAISHEYFLLGDVFPFTEIECPHCRGSNRTPDGEVCNHPDGSFKTIKLMNPDYIDVKDNPIASNPEYYLVPDEELKMLVTRREPKSAYDALPQSLIDLVNTGQPIPLSTRSITHLKHNAADYATYGTSMLQRLFTVLAYKTKMMTANWIVAERLILPIRVVKIGDKDRPATDADLQDVQNQLSAVANDPNLTIVTHHAFDYEWYGACYDDKTEILTPTGWKKFDCVDENSIVGTYDVHTKEIQWEQVDEYHEYDFKSNLLMKMFHFNSKSVDIMVTPNHRMLVNRKGQVEEVYSQDVKHNDKLLSTVDWSGVIPVDFPYMETPLGHLSLDEYLEFAGYYLSEGSLQIERNKGLSKDKQIRTCYISQSENSKCFSNIESSVALAYPSYSDHIDRRNVNICHDFVVNSTEIAKYMADEFGTHSYNKRVPIWIKNLPKDKLEILYKAMMDGDGHVRNDNKMPRYGYATTSRTLADDLSEVCLKLGYFTNTSIEEAKNGRCRDVYRITFSEHRKQTPYTIRKQHIKQEDYDGKVYCVKVPNSWVIVRRSGKIAVCGNTGKIHNITQELEEVGKEILDGLMLNQAILNGEMAGYTSAQVGIEVLIRRLDNWRNKLKLWVEKNIFRPVAMMQGFIDEEESKALGDTVYLYPELTWNDLQLRDKTSRIQTLVQLHDKGLVSAQTLLEELDLDYDSEVEKIREEQILAQANGMVAGGGDPMAGGMGGAPGGDMGGAGMPPDMAGEGMGGAPGGDMAGGMGGAPGGDMAGGMGGMGGMGGAPMGAAASGGELPVIGKRGSKAQQEDEEAPPPMPIKLTKLEGKMFKTLTSMGFPHDLFAQYQVKVPGEARPYAIDFAYPKIGVGIEVDGAIWHERPDFKQRDLNRDQNLGNVGWRILRFNEESLDENMDAVSDVITKHIEEASKQHKAAESNKGFVKHASTLDVWENPYYEQCLSEGEIGCNRGSVPFGKILYIGNVKNG